MMGCCQFSIYFFFSTLKQMLAKLSQSFLAMFASSVIETLDESNLLFVIKIAGESIESNA